jgi:hypothetical protein
MLCTVINFTNLVFETNPNQGNALQATLIEATAPCSSSSYTQLGNCVSNATGNFLINATYLIQRHPTFEITLNDVERSNSLLPLILDTQNFDKYPMEHNPNDMKQYYNDSLVNIINETYFFNNIIHITEKTYKPIAFMQPFIMVSSPFSLKHLKDMGFQTFDKFWDESYDEETNHAIRMNMIVNLVETICNWTETEKLNFSYQVADILKYNRDHLKTMKHIEMDRFINNYSA